MAVHHDYPGLTVEILVDGKPLEEYENTDEEEQPKTITRYVECRSGAEFAITTKFRAPFTPMDTQLRACLDVMKVDGKFVKKHGMLEGTHCQSKTMWREGGSWLASNFVFSDLSIGV
jgi:hypothetical protein